MMNHSSAQITPIVRWDTPTRDAMCLGFAIVLHSMLLLWRGGLLTLPESGQGLGDMLVSVDFRSDIPDFQPAGGGGAPRAQNIFARMKSMLKGEGATGKKSTEIAMGTNTEPIKADKPAWTKTDTLTDKVFAEKKGFQGVAQKDALDISKGQTQEVLVKPSQGNFKQAAPNLKEKNFSVSNRDMPFKVVNANQKDQLVNVNAIPMSVGKTTTANVKSLDGGAGSGPALQSKTFASRGASSNAGFGGAASSSKGGAGSGQLAMGGSMGGAAGAGTGAIGAGTGGASGYGSGAGTGTGSGNGSGAGSGFGKGNGGGRSWGGGGGTGFGNGTGMETLPRHTVSDSVSSGSKSAYNSGFNITGALAHRPIAQKVLATYEMNCRVSLRFRVDWSGKVLDGILVEVSSGSPTFDQKVVGSLKQWLFSRLSADRTNEIQEGVITFVFKGV